jgi:hypothetical protein
VGAMKNEPMGHSGYVVFPLKPSKPLRLAVVGSREYPRMDVVRQFMWEQEATTTIISGGAPGVDRLAVIEAKRRAMDFEEYLPDWNRHGRKAGAIRNAEIVAKADQVVAFWDEESPGTPITIDMAKRAGKLLAVYGRNGLPLTDDAVARSVEASTNRPRA